ncbi:hypothetical protein D3C81_2274990 [compost metagenome]
MCPGVTAEVRTWAKASNTETKYRGLPERQNPDKTQSIDFKGFKKVGTAPAISIAQQE